MKKTIIAMLALSGIAFGAGVDNNDFTAGFGGTVWANEISGLSFLIEEGDSITSCGTVLAAFGGNSSDGYTNATAGANVFELAETNGVITLSVGVASLSNLGEDYEITSSTTKGAWFEAGRWKTFETTLQKDVIYTITGTGTNENLTLVLNWDGGSETLATYNGNTNGGTSTAYITRINQNYATPDTPAIPEPATATLSLLALAGLAARRRRK